MRRSVLLRAGIVITGLGLSAWIASLWVISYRVRSPARDWSGVLWQGELMVTNMGTYLNPGLRCFHTVPPLSQLARLRWWPDDGLLVSYPITNAPMWMLRLPLWLPTLLGGAIVGVHRLGARARRRNRAGHCFKCGYDRAGLASIAPCPECGAGQRLVRDVNGG